MLGAVADYWRLLINPEDTSRDAALLDRDQRAPSPSAEAWVAREPKRAEAWFYLGGAYGTRVLLRGCCAAQYLSAARDGKRIHDALQLAISLDPTLRRRLFRAGPVPLLRGHRPARRAHARHAACSCRQAIAPAACKEMEQDAATAACLLRGEADYQLHLIYLWYERQTDDGAARWSKGCARATRTTRCSTFELAERAERLRSQSLRRACRHIDRCSTRRAPGAIAMPAIVGGERASRHGAGDGRALRQRRRDRAAERGHRAEACGAVRVAARARTISSAWRTIARDDAPMRSRRINSALVDQSRATIDCVASRRSAQRSRARRRRARCR